jgi:dynein light chain roadblock-type
MSEVEEALNRISMHKGVKGIIIVNYDGISIRSTFKSAEETHRYASLISNLTLKARSTIRELDQDNDLMFLRIRSKKHEIMVAPDRDYMLVVIQNPDDEKTS